ncbi:MAG: putative toxin-antitoxin system toxin component, PIN family [Gallionella sp.]|nr:putative toxin-antitoxin system toxin component, PIN family [Gallionella sp.]
MRLVLDTNIVASGLLWNGTPARLLDAAQAGAIEIYTSRILLAELTRILKRAKFAKAIAANGVGLEGLVLGYAELATLVEPVPIPPSEVTGNARSATLWMASSLPLLPTV